MRDCGVEGEDGFAQRAVFIVDPNNEIQFTHGHRRFRGP